jgi:small-conductance mechanosensitive channel
MFYVDKYFRALLLRLLTAIMLPALLLFSPPALALTAEQATAVGGDLGDTSKRLQAFKESGARVLAAAPHAWDDLLAAAQRVAQATGPRDPTAQAWTIVWSVLAMLAMVLLLRRLTQRARRACLDDPMRARGALGLLGFEALDRVVLAALAYLQIEFVFVSGLIPDLLGVAILWSIVRWWVVIWLLEILLRPGLPQFRLVGLGERSAIWLKRVGMLASYIGILGISVMPVLLRAGLPVPSGQVVALAQGLLVAAGGLACLWLFARLEIAPYRVPSDGRSLLLRRSLLALAALMLALLWLSWSVGVVALKFSVFHSLVWSLRIALGVVVLDAILRLAAAQAGSQRLALWIPFAQRSLRLVAVLAIGIMLAELWLVDELALVSEAAWLPVRRSLVVAALTLIAGYALWRYLSHWMEQRLGSDDASEGGDEDEDAESKPATRLVTILPLLRLVLGVAIPLVAVMIALSQLGVDIGPLLAAASVFGLAISFGSQALVRDVVSGIFFIADDAFRRGEYIDTGKLKGSVEKLTLRSVRLRHQNGQVHTIPYGQLTSVTNFSRDYQTLKFNLRLARDVDIEQARKVVKRVGQQMMEDPELGKELLQPLKMQGVAEIADNALVVRLKFTCKPAKPSFVQREALKRVYKAFGEAGIGFASSTITVQSAGASALDGTALAAAAAGAASAAPLVPGAAASA